MNKAITGTNATLEIGGKRIAVKKWSIITTFPHVGPSSAKRKRLLAKVTKRLRCRRVIPAWTRKTMWHMDLPFDVVSEFDLEVTA